MIAPILALAAIVGLAWYSRHARAEQDPPSGSQPAPDPWETVRVKTVDGETFFDVFAKAGAFGPHQRMRVMRWKEDRQGRRVFVGGPEGVPPEVIAQAIDDFAIQQVP